MKYNEMVFSLMVKEVLYIMLYFLADILFHHVLFIFSVEKQANTIQHVRGVSVGRESCMSYTQSTFVLFNRDALTMQSYETRWSSQIISIMLIATVCRTGKRDEK